MTIREISIKDYKEFKSSVQSDISKQIKKSPSMFSQHIATMYKKTQNGSFDVLRVIFKSKSFLDIPVLS